MIQWLRLPTPNAWGPGLIPGQETRSNMPQLKILHAAAKTWLSQINKCFFSLKEEHNLRHRLLPHTFSFGYNLGMLVGVHCMSESLYIWTSIILIVRILFIEQLLCAPWKKSYDKPRQNIKKQKYYFANKDPSSPSYGFSSSHVQM